ncbi:uncharacterized protein BHQ10_003348 [Talaromyces amestolkiae]|uniref:Uncharacterized protein n=1 Tax=Talaromyces amestolkiae TaxID=1196081 RepID=A0A364KUV6_TALAM|nr:uncharacterized protein BHQ10_003348 [Talaromyces amestolkiae]RAO67336.1 hypothetical protein BHQ10_003348 [Talaromyces amestolkiae]
MSSNHPDKSHPTPAKKDDQPTTTTATTAATTSNTNNGQQPSLLSRIQNSASTLIQDTLTKPSGAILSGDLAHVLDSGNKASSSASFSGGTYSGQTRSTDGFGGGNSSAGGHQDGGHTTGLVHEGFRSSQPNSHDVSEIDSFENSGDFFNSSDNYFIRREDEAEGKGKGKSREHALYDNHNFSHDQNIDIEDEYESSHFNAYEIAWINASRSGTVYRSTSTESTPSKRSSQSQSDFNDFTAQSQTQYENEHDGAEVVMMLSDPSFQPGLVTWDDDENEHYDRTDNGLGFDLDDNDPLDSEGFPHALARGLSPAEMQILDSFRKQQPEQLQQKKITALSLVPDIDSFFSEHDTSTINANNDALRNEVIANLIGAEEWFNVDERYGDEVWGYLRPAVEAAATEIKEKEVHKDGEGGDGDGPAVKRLKMILRHMARL